MQRRPKNEPPRSFAPPAFACRRHRLSSGLRLVTVELPHLHTVSIVVYARVGSRYESPRANGLSHFLEHMLFRGTERLPDAYQLNLAIERIGGTLYAETGRDYSLYQISLHPESLAEGLALFGEIFTAPTFADLDVERRIVVEEMLEDLDERGRLINVDDLARREAFRGHPLGQPITGPLDNVERFRLADVRRHFRTYYGAENLVLTVSGAARHEEVRRLAERAFKRLPAGRSHGVTTPPEPSGPPRLYHVEHDGTQTSVQVVFRSVAELDPDYAALMMMARIIDDGMSTRLHRRLVDELGLAYSVSASLDPFVDCGLYDVDAAANHASVPELVEETLAVCAGLADAPPEAEELEKARRRYRWDLQRSFDDADQMAGWWGGTSLFYPPRSAEERLRRVAQVTPDDVQRVARRIFRPERLTLVTVGRLGPRREARLARIVARWADRRA